MGALSKMDDYDGEKDRVFEHPVGRIEDPQAIGYLTFWFWMLIGGWPLAKGISKSVF